jgi:D-sedoheptulose 7-phosphate isomerase
MGTSDINVIYQQIEDSILLKRDLQKQAANLVDIAAQITQAVTTGHKVLIFGNGGSAADAQHIVAELVGRFYGERRPLPALALTTNTSILTAIANDYGYDDVFARQVAALVESGDMVVGISTSGKSVSVIKGIEEAKRRGAVTIAFTGEGGALADFADYTLSVPSKDTPRIQEAHITAGHIICYLVEKAVMEQDCGK